MVTVDAFTPAAFLSNVSRSSVSFTFAETKWNLVHTTTAIGARGLSSTVDAAAEHRTTGADRTLNNTRFFVRFRFTIIPKHCAAGTFEATAIRAQKPFRLCWIRPHVDHITGSIQGQHEHNAVRNNGLSSCTILVYDPFCQHAPTDHEPSE